jgi:hypothetical protein
VKNTTIKDFWTADLATAWYILLLGKVELTSRYGRVVTNVLHIQKMGSPPAW